MAQQVATVKQAVTVNLPVVMEVGMEQLPAVMAEAVDTEHLQVVTVVVVVDTEHLQVVAVVVDTERLQVVAVVVDTERLQVVAVVVDTERLQVVTAGNISSI
jgi:hypothetical protein